MIHWGQALNEGQLGSAGSVLHSLRRLGGGLAFALCARGFAVRLQGSLRTDPAPLRFFGAPRHRSDARREAQGRMYVRSAPPGHRKPARGETPGMAHNRSVLKERRIPPGALTCFAVAEWLGWRWGSVPRWGSAGSVLRSQGTLGPAGLSRCRARGIRMSTFLCSLRPGPAAAGLLEGLSLYGDGLIVAHEEK